MYDEAWNEGKLDVVDEICAPDYVGVGPYGDEHGPESVKSGILTAPPGISRHPRDHRGHHRFGRQGRRAPNISGNT